MPRTASSAAAVLIGHIAVRTTTMRVGSGGVMLPNHAPRVVAEQFGILEALHPRRIDHAHCVRSYELVAPEVMPTVYHQLR